MKTRNEESQPEKSVANPSKRARLDSLLFKGAKPDIALAIPKLPPMTGE